MPEKDDRYEVVECDGHWYVIDRQNPEHPAPVYNRKVDAAYDCRVWNLLTRPTRL